ncbi:MAG TPA: nuclear transport factor 2 family protein [Thermoleophilaceae bacterium]|nr:nuclear transport factor 2 family protein [Thermoleophilaceae bacterium]
MSEENVEVVRRAFEAWNSGDMDALAALYDRDAVIWGPEEWPEPGPLLGREAIMRQFELMRAAYETDELEPTRIDHIADRVVVRFIWRGVGQGPELNMELTYVYSVRKGKIRSAEVFRDHGEALEALGLPA